MLNCTVETEHSVTWNQIILCNFNSLAQEISLKFWHTLYLKRVYEIKAS